MNEHRKGARLGAWTVAALAAVTLGAAACSDMLGGDDTETTTISFRTHRNGALALQGASSPSSASLAVVPVTGGGHTVDVTSIDMVFDRVKLERAHASGEEDSDSENEADSDARNDETFRAGATTVALPLDGTTTISPFTAPLPLGTYDELQMTAQFARIKGTYDGQAFDVTVPVNAKLETRLDPPLVVASDADRPNVTVLIDPLLWFRNPDGSVIDPRQLATNATLQQSFRNRIRASFRAFEDQDKDGDESDSDSDRR